MTSSDFIIAFTEHDHEFTEPVIVAVTFTPSARTILLNISNQGIRRSLGDLAEGDILIYVDRSVEDLERGDINLLSALGAGHIKVSGRTNLLGSLAPLIVTAID
ncbi:MAG: hypothetical protein HKL87_01670 [Acidimicrobiaceae bacterium]|nr:hypothetical protein [Acidimicrobiaceae bacterium]